MKRLTTLSRVFVLCVVAVSLLRACALTNVRPGEVGVRYNNALGPLAQDLHAGWHFEIMGLQRIWRLPRHFLFLEYMEQEALSIRTKDNNTVNVDVTVPYRIIPGKAHAVMDAGNHLTVANGQHRFERLANETTISVLRENLAQLKSQDFYNTDRRIEVAATTLKSLNEALKPLNLEAAEVLLRSAYFRAAYEQQLARIQLNEQQKLLDNAKKLVANQQQKLDNYSQRTKALAAARSQDWKRRIAELDRAYQVGLIDMGDDRSPGAARRALERTAPAQKPALRQRAAALFGMELAKVDDAHLLGIKNVEAETMEYDRRVRSGADGVAARLAAEGQAKIAEVKGRYEARLNQLLNSAAGRAYVAYRAADNLQFSKILTFQSSDGVPAVLRLRDFAIKFMGR